MLFLNAGSQYDFSYATLKIIDETAIDDSTAEVEREVPDFNVLIPTVQAIGSTNKMELYWPDGLSKYLRNHGNPNHIQYGFGPDYITAVLNRPNANVGVYTVNLRGPSATIANIVVLMKYKVEEGVPYLDGSGNQYYKDADGQLTTDYVEGGEITRDVLHVKFETTKIEELKNWRGLHNGLNAIVNDTEDDEGYRTLPWFGVMYQGASAWANNTYFSMVPTVAEYDNNTYYGIKLFDGVSMKTTESIYSFDRDAGGKRDLSYYIEEKFNEVFPTMRWMTAEDSDRIVELFNKYLYSVDDYLNDKMDSPTMKFSSVDPFTVDTFGIVVDEGSVNSQLTNAFQMTGGYDGDETRDELFEMFYRGQIITDITNPLCYRIPYIPDIGYNQQTKDAIAWLIGKRMRTTSASIMLGNTESFQSAVIDHQANWMDDNPNIHQLTWRQAPMMYNEYTRRTVTTPTGYFDLIALLDNMIKWGHPFHPCAGADCRYQGYVEDTMAFADEEPAYMQSLQKARINVVMHDNKSGAYIADQLMNTRQFSDQTELNNAFIISCMVYDLIDLVHRNHFKFNEADQVRQFNEAVESKINTRYAEHSASISATVTRLGTVGRARYTNKITVRVDLKDINRYTDIEIILVDE
ncbi:MAG: hypothetical protein NC114_06465 [Ruminococcus flavefaciens]|nr:hypothetical protein [Ruminococcus flavefaciens]